MLFISSEADDTFPTVRVPAPEGRDYLTTKTRLAFKYIYDNHLDDADWFLKADDDTFVILENLRHFLEPYSPEEPVYFGHHFKAYLKQGYHSGGAGYVLSKEALRRLVEKGISTHKCLYLKGAEDLAMVSYNIYLFCILSTAKFSTYIFCLFWDTTACHQEIKWLNNAK